MIAKKVPARRAVSMAALSLLLGPFGGAADPPPPAPRVTALAPIAVAQGFRGTVRLRGFRLKDATAVRLESAGRSTSLAIKEKKDATTPAGVEASVAGDSEIVVELTLPADAPAGPLSLVVAAGEQSAAPVVLTVRAPTALAAVDPGTGFQNAPWIGLGQVVPGVIGGQREVDVYAVEAVAGKRLRITVTARAAASLLDPFLSVHDGNGRLLAAHDDISVDNCDAALEVTPAVDGPVYCVVQDAHDTGSEWHAYLLEVVALP
ncbi:MAG: PPC domain-containing protein [Verrucomicrobiales bacterium]